MGKVTTRSGWPSWSRADRSRCEIVRERLVVGVVGARLDHGHDGPRIDETGEVVHVAVRVVADDAPAQPDDVADAQIIGQDLLQLRAVETRVAALHRRSAGTPRWSAAAPAVDVDGASFEHHANRLSFQLDPRNPALQTELSRDPPRDLPVLEMVVIFGPGVEFPVDQPDGTGRRFLRRIRGC